MFFFGCFKANGEKLNTLITSRASELQDKLNAVGLKFLEDAKKENDALTTNGTDFLVDWKKKASRGNNQATFDPCAAVETGGVVVVPSSKGVGMYPTEASSVQVCVCF